jgi:hypothetical protein
VVWCTLKILSRGLVGDRVSVGVGVGSGEVGDGGKVRAVAVRARMLRRAWACIFLVLKRLCQLVRFG